MSGKHSYVYRETSPGHVEAIEVGSDWMPTDSDSGHKSDAEIYNGLKTPEGKPIDSRTKFRNYLKHNKVALRSDYDQTLAKKRKERDAFFKGERPAEHHRQMDEALGRAYYRAEQGKRGRGK